MSCLSRQQLFWPTFSIFSPTYVLHYGPLEGSKNGEAVLNYRYGLPDETWPEPNPDDPLSPIDKVENEMVTSLEASEVC